MEEIVHTHTRHRPSGIVPAANGLQVREYNKAQETEAYGIGAAALLPWGQFFKVVNVGRSIDEIAGEFQVTAELIEYRIKITGAYRVYRARQRSLH